MPSPLEILLDPISLGFIFMYALLILLETILPGNKLPKVKGWFSRTLISFIAFFYLSSYLPLLWDQYLSAHQLFNLNGLGVYFGAAVGLLVFELLIYIWHRTMHKTNWLWRSFHQLHHSAERLDGFGAFYFSPLDMIGFTMIGSLAVVFIVGISPQAATLFLFASSFLGIFQHLNINTPRWLGYFIQRPESHSVHHCKGIHAFNYSDLPIFDILFGTFKNPKEFVESTGFYDGASRKIPQMLFFRDISKPTS